MPSSGHVPSRLSAQIGGEQGRIEEAVSGLSLSRTTLLRVAWRLTLPTWLPFLPCVCLQIFTFISHPCLVRVLSLTLLHPQDLRLVERQASTDPFAPPHKDPPTDAEAGGARSSPGRLHLPHQDGTWQHTV